MKIKQIIDFKTILFIGEGQMNFPRCQIVECLVKPFVVVELKIARKLLRLAHCLITSSNKHLRILHSVTIASLAGVVPQKYCPVHDPAHSC